MAFFKRFFTRLLGTIDESTDQIGTHLRRPFPKIKGIQIIPYRGFSNGKNLFLKGRVLKNPFVFVPRDKESAWRNLMDTYQRFNTREMAGVEVELRWNESVHIATTDEEGYFSFILENLPGPSEFSTYWNKLPLRLLTQTADEATIVNADVLVPAKNAQFGIISDIDDTVLVSNVTQRLRMAKLAFFQSARKRLPFAGVAAFYKALQKGTKDNAFNPIFYVSSSPWNLFDMLTEFFNWQGIPAGPLLLKDIGVSRAQVGGASHLTHKLAQIEVIMKMYPDLQFILIGDSGQHDPEIYHRVVQDYPNRVLAIYIRDVSKDKRDMEVQTIISTLAEFSVPMFLVPDTEIAAQHASANQWIESDALNEIRSSLTPPGQATGTA